ELFILLDAPLEKLENICRPEIIEGIRRVRQGRLLINPGFDGEYGEIKIFTAEEKLKQKELF
ncbi:MAG: DNA helicase UvrD, partial [Patescibacteria group bacterium]